MAKEVPIGKEVHVYHRGEVRKGFIKGLARKASVNHGEVYIWVAFPELKGDYYYQKLAKLKDIT